MSVKTATEQLNDALLDVYDAVSIKGGTVAAQKNAANLATSISSISGGGSDPEILVPDGYSDDVPYEHYCPQDPSYSNSTKTFTLDAPHTLLSTVICPYYSAGTTEEQYGSLKYCATVKAATDNGTYGWQIPNENGLFTFEFDVDGDRVPYKTPSIFVGHAYGDPNGRRCLQRMSDKQSLATGCPYKIDWSTATYTQEQVGTACAWYQDGKITRTSGLGTWYTVASESAGWLYPELENFVLSGNLIVTSPPQGLVVSGQHLYPGYDVEAHQRYASNNYVGSVCSSAYDLVVLSADEAKYSIGTNFVDGKLAIFLWVSDNATLAAAKEALSLAKTTLWGKNSYDGVCVENPNSNYFYEHSAEEQAAWQKELSAGPHTVTLISGPSDKFYAHFKLGKKMRLSDFPYSKGIELSSDPWGGGDTTPGVLFSTEPITSSKYVPSDRG